jgi:hypothetical protein
VTAAAQGHELVRSLTEDVWYPPHEKRHASSLYRRTHRRLVVEMDTPCWICQVRHSDVLRMPLGLQRVFQLETHHSELEWAAANGVDLAKITADFDEIMGDPARLRAWLDSEGNMLVLCAAHHRAGRTGIHTITYPAWKLQRWQSAAWTFIVQPERELVAFPRDVA